MLTPGIEAIVARHKDCQDEMEPCDVLPLADALAAAEADADALRTLLGNVLDRSTPMHSTTCAGQDDDAPCICGTVDVIDAARAALQGEEGRTDG